jgi:beta-1,4-mannosyl-glycoprotein beta-1,4-N-acetylglucosaminyltransferase
MKLIDCFCFLQELDLLEIRLNELKDVVDCFLIVESNITGSGIKKDYHLEKFYDRFKDFNIKYKKADLLDHRSRISQDQHLLMYLQRESMLEGLKELSLDDSDLILFSDLDEIPKHDVINNIKINGLQSNPSVLSIRGYYWFCDTPISAPSNHAWFNCPIVINYGQFKNSNLRALRDNKDGLPSIPNAGWHFSHTGTLEEKRVKMLASSHTEYNSDHYTSLENIQRRSLNLIDPYDRGGFAISNTNDAGLPAYLENNKTRFSHLLWNHTKN